MNHQSHHSELPKPLTLRTYHRARQVLTKTKCGGIVVPFQLQTSNSTHSRHSKIFQVSQFQYFVSIVFGMVDEELSFPCTLKYSDQEDDYICPHRTKVFYLTVKHGQNQTVGNQNFEQDLVDWANQNCWEIRLDISSLTPSGRMVYQFSCFSCKGRFKVITDPHDSFATFQ